jgi:hypothetical protein
MFGKFYLADMKGNLALSRRFVVVVDPPARVNVLIDPVTGFGGALR